MFFALLLRRGDVLRFAQQRTFSTDEEGQTLSPIIHESSLEVESVARKLRAEIDTGMYVVVKSP
jgi:hypothetical protein